MSRQQKSNMALYLGLAIMALIGAGFGVLLVRAQVLPSGVEPIAWDRVACAHCRMHVSEPPFATQLQLKDGQVLNFDDPGCFFQYEAAHQGLEVHGVYFHHSVENRWLQRADVEFLTGATTPMGWGLAAVVKGTPGAISLEAARAKATAQKHAHGEPEARR
jgi:hypothetical protein